MDTEREYRTQLEKMSTSEMLNAFKANMTAICTVINTVIGENEEFPDPRKMNEIIQQVTPRMWVEMFMDPISREPMHSNLKLMKAMEDVNRENRLIITRMLRTVVAD
jgi:hypothetical protein